MKPDKKTYIHLLLFVVTLASTWYVGLGEGWIGALWYCGGLMTILLCHEMGHFLAAKHHYVPTTLPYFLPMPLPPFGTLGAIIKMQGAMPNRKALFDVGVAGPFAGYAMILPAVVVGLKLSPVVNVGAMNRDSMTTLGDSLLFKIVSFLVHGPLKDGQDVVLHPLAYAAWVGLLVTSINLLPIGQLDGGHIMYALFGKKSRWPAWGFYLFFLYICLFHYFGWLLLIVLLAIFRKHPPTLNDYPPLDAKRKWLGALALILFLLSFTPVPFNIGSGIIPMILDWIRG